MDDFENETVLFVDDEPGITQSIKRGLRREPYSILTANSADEALGILKEQHVAVVVSDEKMPKVSGSEFLATVRVEYPDTIRIMFTGYASLETATRALNNGDVFRFLKKPCNEIDLAIAVRQGLQHRKLFMKCHSLLNAVRVLREYLHIVGSRHPESKDVLRELLDSSLEEPFTMNIKQLIDDLERELNGLLEFSGHPHDEMSVVPDEEIS